MNWLLAGLSFNTTFIVIRHLERVRKGHRRAKRRVIIKDMVA